MPGLGLPFLRLWRIGIPPQYLPVLSETVYSHRRWVFCILAETQDGDWTSSFGQITISGDTCPFSTRNRLVFQF